MTDHASTYFCNLCGGSALQLLIDFGQHPVAKHYLIDREAEQPTWPVRLYFCGDCGLTQLHDSCPPEVLYENYVTLSAWKPQPHAAREIDLISGLDGIGRQSAIVEIGSNDGSFLYQMASGGFENTLGIEPAKDAYDASIGKGIRTLQAFLTPDLARKLAEREGQFDLFVSRQNLEHMSDLRGVAAAIDALVRADGYVLIEVPNFGCNLDWSDYSLWEEHVNYFTVDTLRYFLALAGVEVIHYETILFSGEGMFVIGRKTGRKSPPLQHVPTLRDRNFEYAARWPDFRRSLNSYLAEQKRQEKKIAVYGAGSRVFCFLNFTGAAEFVDVIVDDQPEKQNRLMPGGRVPITSSETLHSQRIDLCLLGVNTENEDKVITKHAQWVRGGGRFWSVLPPSNRLLPVWDHLPEWSADAV